jgi:hypothetical protein
MIRRMRLFDQAGMRLAGSLPRWPMRHDGDIAPDVLSPAVDAAIKVVVTQMELRARRDERLLSCLAFTEATPAVGLSCFYFSLDLAA